MRILACVLLAAAAAALAIVTVGEGFVFLTAAPVAALVALVVRLVRRDKDDPQGRLDLPGQTAQHARLSLKAMISAAVATATGGALLYAAGVPLGSRHSLVGVVLVGGALGIWATALIRRALVDRSSGMTGATGAPYPDGRAAAAVMGPASRGERIASWVFAALAVLARRAMGGPVLFLATRQPGAGEPDNAGITGPFGPLAPAAIGAGFFSGPVTAGAVAIGAVFTAIPWLTDDRRDAATAPGGWLAILSEPLRVGAGALIAAVTVALLRSLHRAFIGLRGGGDPFRVRFEIGGLGTRVEDMTLASDRGMDTTRLWGLLLLCAVSFFYLAPNTHDVLVRMGATLVLILGAVVVATVIGRMVGTVGAASGVVLLAVVLAATTLIADTNPIAAWWVPSAAALMIVGFVAAELGQDHRAAATFGEAPWRIEGVALLGVLLGGLTLWVGLSWCSARFPSELPKIVYAAVLPLHFSHFLPSTEISWYLGALIGLVAEVRWRAGVAVGLGALIPVTWSAPFLLGGFLRWIMNPGHHARLAEHAAAGLMIGDALAIVGMVWLA